MTKLQLLIDVDARRRAAVSRAVAGLHMDASVTVARVEALHAHGCLPTVTVEYIVSPEQFAAFQRGIIVDPPDPAK